MSSWFSCCCGSRKAIPEVSPTRGIVSQETQPLQGSLLGSKVSILSSSNNSTLTAISSDPLQSYLHDYQSMESRSLTTTSDTIGKMVRQTTEPMIRRAVAVKMREPDSAPVIFSKPRPPTSSSILVRQSTIPVLYEVPPFQRSTTETSEAPILARSFSEILPRDSTLEVLQKQNRSLEEELQIALEKSVSLETEVGRSAEELEKERQKIQTLETAFAGLQKEHLKSLMRNTHLEKRLAEEREKIRKVESSASFLQTPTDGRVEKGGSLSDIEEEEKGRGSQSAKTHTLIELQQERAKMEGKCQRLDRHLKECKGKIENLQRKNNWLEMELDKQVSLAKDLGVIQTKTQEQLEKRERSRHSLEKREVEVEKLEEDRAKADAQKTELEKQIQQQELLLQEQRNNLKKLSIEKDSIIKERDAVLEQLKKSEEAIQESLKKNKQSEKNIDEIESLLSKEKERNEKQKKEIEQLRVDLITANSLLAGYTISQEPISSLQRSISMPLKRSTSMQLNYKK